jgi:membrane-associated protein
METAIDIFLHLDQHLNTWAEYLGVWLYLLLFVIIFCETGLVVTPILPGDSLLFAAGALAALGGLDPFVLFVLLSVAAILGDAVNYQAGQYFGARIFKPDARILKTAYLERTHEFYERHGPKTIVIARFVPIVRTFAPFVAGMGRMTYRRFAIYNVTGGILWVGVCVAAGYLFGNIPIVRENFTLVLLAIIFISILPGIIGIINSRRGSGPTGSQASAD